MDALAIFARNLKAARTAAGLTQEELSGRIEMDPAQYGKIERGQVDPSVRTVARIAAGLELSAADLLRAEDVGPHE